MGRRGLLVVISAPSGTGKGVLRRQLLREMPDLRFCVSVTSRPPRPGEQEGVDYYFVSPEEFQRRIQEEVFVEWAKVYGNYYGTPGLEIGEALERGEDVLLEKDVQGGRELRKKFPDGIFIFILPPRLESLEERLKGRGTESQGDLQRRLTAVKIELAELRNYDYLVINDEIDRAVQDLRAIIVAERCRISRMDVSSPFFQWLGR
ncbi:MAG: guanylate kinase [Firmicutes bacterium]|nr:guanylate kinase [Bacillota bacterium]MCL5038283.1 guanylate kinase [Bacillota bacterium]